MLARTTLMGVFFLVPLLGMVPAAAQQETFGESIDVELVELTIYVTGKGGEPVTDLRRDELRIEVEGEPVEVSHFAVHLPAAEMEGQMEAEADETTMPSAAAIDPDAPTVEEAEPVRYIAYVDDLNLRPHSRRRVLDRLQSFFDESLQPEDEVMVVSSSPRLRIRETFTTDRDRVNEALRQLDQGSARGSVEDLERSALMQEVAFRYMDADAAAMEQDRLGASMRFQEEQELARARRSLAILDELVGAVAALPGRKVLLHVSDGLSLTPTDDHLSRLAARAAAARVVLVPVDGGGAARLDPRGGAASGAVGSFWSPETAQLRQDNRQLTLLSLAEETGGKMLLYKNMARLPKMREDLDSYYTIAFTPPPGPPGRDRRVEIEVTRRGIDVRHPRSFRIHSEDERLRRALRAALASPGGAPNPLKMKVELGAALEQAEGGWMLPLLVRVPLTEVALLPEDEAHEGSLTLLWMVQDEEGGQSRIFEEAMPITIPKEQWEEAKGRDVGHQLRLRLSPRVVRAALAVRDDVGGETVAVGFPLVFGTEE